MSFDSKIEQTGGTQSQLEALKAPIPQELVTSVENSYKTLFRKILGIPKASEVELIISFHTPEECLKLQGAMHDIFSRNSRAFNARSAEVLTARYGLITGTPQTLEQVAASLGLARETVKQIERRALKGLSRPAIKENFAGLVEIRNP